MAPRGTISGSICIEVTLSDIETIWTKFGKNPGFSLRNFVSLTPGPTIKVLKIPHISKMEKTAVYQIWVFELFSWSLKIHAFSMNNSLPWAKNSSFVALAVCFEAILKRMCNSFVNVF